MNLDESDAQLHWTRWLDEHGWRLLAHARQLHSRPSDAEDLVQEVFLELWRNRTSEHPPDLPLALLKLRQRAIDQGRSSTRRAIREQGWQQGYPDHVVPDLDLDQAHRMRILQEALNQIPVSFREVISLKLWGELTFDQIGELLEISRNTAASRYRIALGRLKPLVQAIRP